MLPHLVNPLFSTTFIISAQNPTGMEKTSIQACRFGFACWDRRVPSYSPVVVRESLGPGWEWVSTFKLLKRGSCPETAISPGKPPRLVNSDGPCHRGVVMVKPDDPLSMSQLLRFLEWQLDRHIRDGGYVPLVFISHNKYRVS